mmetsp:Transcript_1922/g.5372  ORF Transcript_1922/g.5372 Transcript_1922/m.5372 type:complete len:82 (-) Transcript_1922:955-1200(-)
MAAAAGRIRKTFDCKLEPYYHPTKSSPCGACESNMHVAHSLSCPKRKQAPGDIVVTLVNKLKSTLNAHAHAGKGTVPAGDH